MTTTETKIDIDFQTEKGLSEFLNHLGISLAVSTYQTGNVFFIAPDTSTKIKINLIRLGRAMGITAHKNSLYIGSAYQIIKYNNILPPGIIHEGADKYFIPQQIWITGEQDCHDIVIEKTGRVVFVNTLHSCLATLDGHSSFVPIWKPPIITEIKHEDRCHLNGVTLRDGEVYYATAFSKNNEREGWRKNKEKSGVVWDIKNDKIIAENLTMPHSPRWHNNKLWLLESGSGTLGSLNFSTGKIEPLIKLPGYLRGLTFYGNYAFIGSSSPRENSGLLSQKISNKEEPFCGVIVVDLNTGKIVTFIKIVAGVQEIYDVAVLPNCVSPKALELDSKELHTTVSIGTNV